MWMTRWPSARAVQALLDTPELPAYVARLDGPALTAHVDAVGLADAAGLLMHASEAQMLAVIDAFLFSSDARPTLEPAAVEAWLSALWDGGEAAVCARFRTLDAPLAHAVLRALVHVFDEATLADLASAERDGRVDKRLESSLVEPMDGYVLVARAGEAGWDLALQTVAALATQDWPLASAVLEACARLDASLLASPDALCSALSDAASCADDLAAAHDARRRQAGYVPVSDARAWLSLAGSAVPPGPVASWPRDPIARLHCRPVGAAERPMTSPDGLRLGGLVPATRGAAVVATSAALAELASAAPAVYAARMGELVFVAGALLAEAVVRSPGAALEHAVATAALGGLWASARDGRPLSATWAACGADVLFRAARHQAALVPTLSALEQAWGALQARPDGLIAPR